jgi:hypothetical protein
MGTTAHPRGLRRVDPFEQRNGLAHLRRIAAESGWHPKQVATAQAAQDVVDRV